MPKKEITKLLLYGLQQTPVERASDDVVQSANPTDQARRVCAILERAVPNRVTLEFCRLTGADYEKILEVGAGVRKYSCPTSGAKITEEQAREILAQKDGDAGALSAKYGIGIPQVRRIWRGASWGRLSPSR